MSVTLGATAALRDVDLRVDAGEAIAIIGPSGAGKTTLLRVLAGVLDPDRGSASVDGVPLAGLTQRERQAIRASIGFVHQDHALVPVLRVLQNVIAGRLGKAGLSAGLRRMVFPLTEEREAVHATLERVGIGETLYKRVDRLSGGQQQRVAIARALYQEPRALLADEPVASVDPVRSRAIIQLLIDVAKERGATLIASLHDVELAVEFFPRIVGVRDGRVVFDVRADEHGTHAGLDKAMLQELYEQGDGQI